MNIDLIGDAIAEADRDTLAPIPFAALQRLGQLGRPAAATLAHIVADNDVDFDEAADWIGSIAAGELSE